MFSDSIIAMNPTNMSEQQIADFKVKFAPFYERFPNMPSRRFIKTHLPMKLMPRNIKEVGAKVIYVARNPKDMCVSWFHFHKTNGFQERFIGEFDSFAKYFTDGLSAFWMHFDN